MCSAGRLSLLYAFPISAENAMYTHAESRPSHAFPARGFTWTAPCASSRAVIDTKHTSYLGESHHTQCARCLCRRVVPLTSIAFENRYVVNKLLTSNCVVTVDSSITATLGTSLVWYIYASTSSVIQMHRNRIFNLVDSRINECAVDMTQRSFERTL